MKLFCPRLTLFFFELHGVSDVVSCSQTRLGDKQAQSPFPLIITPFEPLLHLVLFVVHTRSRVLVVFNKQLHIMSDNRLLHGASQALLGVSDDDDMDYTTTEASGDEDDVEILEGITEDDDEDDDEYTDADEGMEEMIQEMLDSGDLVVDDEGEMHEGERIDVDDEDDEDEEDEDEGEDEGEEGETPTTFTVSAEEINAALQPPTEPAGPTLTNAEARQQMLRNLLSRPGVLRQLGLEGLFRNVEEEEDEEEASARQNARYLRARRRMQENPHPPIDLEPQPNGTAIMESGGFGIIDREKSVMSNRKRVASRIMQRELGLGSPGKERTHNRLVSQELLPSSAADTIINYDHRCYSGQFSEDGNFFFTCGQDSLVRMYDTSNPYNWKLYKTVQYHHMAWTISDATLSPDNKWLAYSSLKHIVSLASTDPETEVEPQLLDISDMHGGPIQRHRHRDGRREFGVCISSSTRFIV
jgi:WD repeat-containing protein 23